MSQKLTGLKIRARRKARGMTQVELARAAGISAPYLNLIEGNRRPVSETLLANISQILGVESDALDGEAERRMVQALQELAGDPQFANAQNRPGNAEDMVGRHPGWSDLILRLFQSYEDQRQAVVALADRLNRDPFLGENVHNMLTNAASISSAAEILTADGLSPDQRQRFLDIVRNDTSRLANTAQALLSFFDNADMRIGSATPMEHVDAFIFQTGNYFPELEAIAESHQRSSVPSALSGIVQQPMVDHFPTIVSPETRRFDLMKKRASVISGDAIRTIVQNHPTLQSEESQSLASAALLSYATGALLMPYEQFFEAAEHQRYDIDALCRQFGVSYEQATHRLATLRRPGCEGVQFAFMRSDTSGYVTKRLPLPDLLLPRYSTACPLWVVYGAFQAPGTTVRQLGELPSGDQFLFFARAVEKIPPKIGYPRKLLSIMLACSANDADRIAYGDGLDRTRSVVPIGTVCRLCTRTQCSYRQEQPLLADSTSSAKRRMVAAT